jgi:hypothetical protein
MRLRAALPAGVVDAGLASLATFLVGLIAATRLDAAVLGAYALFFTAFLVAAVVPAQLLLLPAEIAALALPSPDRTGVVGRSLKLALPLSAATAAVTTVAAASLTRGVPAEVVLPLAVGAAGTSFLSPLQDHVRKMFHLAGASWRAALMSVIQVVGVVAAIGVFTLAGVATPWIPLGALTAANAVSLTGGLLLRPRRAAPAPRPRLSLRPLLAQGRLLLVVGGVPVAASFLVAATVTRLAGPEPLGFAEAARILSQPLLVLSMGLGAVIGPRSMESGARADAGQARRYAIVFALLIGGASVVYGVIALTPVTGARLAAIFPGAYAVPGLILLTLVGNTLYGIVTPYRSELLGARRERGLAGVEIVGAAGQCLVALVAGALHAYARPAATAVHGVVRLAGYLRLRRNVYGHSTRVTA